MAEALRGTSLLQALRVVQDFQLVENHIYGLAYAIVGLRQTATDAGERVQMIWQTFYLSLDRQRRRFSSCCVSHGRFPWIEYQFRIYSDAARKGISVIGTCPPHFRPKGYT